MFNKSARSLAIIRGLPGCGKTTLARNIQKEPSLVFSADDYFMVGDRYVFDHTQLYKAHEQCFRNATFALSSKKDTAIVCVHNTFVRSADIQQYVSRAQTLQCSWWVIDLFDQGMNDRGLYNACTHGVPIETIAKMRANYETWSLRL